MGDARRDQFSAKHAAKRPGALSGFARVLFRGDRPFFSGSAMASFLAARGVYRRDVKRCVVTQAYRLQDHARQLAAREGRPDHYFGERPGTEDLARPVAEREGITEGLVGVVATVEPGRTFSLRGREGAAFIPSARRQCLILYYYFRDRDFGLIHVRGPTWFPRPRPGSVTGHEWLARQRAQHAGRYTNHDNAVRWSEDFPRAPRFADRFVRGPGGALLDRYARRVNPWLRHGRRPMQYYWVTTQSEYATDLVFKSRQGLTEFFPRRLAHRPRGFSARAVMSCWGRKWHGEFEGEVVTERAEYPLRGRWPGCRVQHRLTRNWLKRSDKAGWILRVETVINDPEEFRGRRRVRRRGRRRPEGVPLRKGVAYLFRYRDGSLPSTARYLNALAPVEDPTAGLRGLDAITPRKRSTKAFNPVARPDGHLVTALMSGEYAVHGCANRDLRSTLAATVLRRRDDPRRQSAQVSRLLHRLPVYGLLAKIPRSRRWRVTAFGQRIMSTSVKLRQWQFPDEYARAA